MTHVTVNLTKQECEELHAAGTMAHNAIKELRREQSKYQNYTTEQYATGILSLTVKTRTIVHFDRARAEKEICDVDLGDFFQWTYGGLDAEKRKTTGYEYAESVTKLKAMLMMLEIGIERGSLELVIEPEQGYLFVYTYLIRLAAEFRLTAEQKKG